MKLLSTVLVIAYSTLTLAPTSTKAQLAETVLLPTEEAKTYLFADWPHMITPTSEKTILRLGTVKANQTIAMIPFKFTTPISLKSPLLGVNRSEPVYPAGTVGFYTGKVLGDGAVYCFFQQKMEKVSFYRPDCFAREVFDKDSYRKIDMQANIPIANEGIFKGAEDYSLFRSPDAELAKIRFVYNFNLSLSVGRWTKTHVSMVWKSNDDVIKVIDTPLKAEGLAEIPLKTGRIIIRRDQDKSRYKIEYIPIA
jgi:hypothetical protein